MVLDILANVYQRTILFLMYALLFSLFIALGFVKWGKIVSLFAGIRRKTWLWLLITFLVGGVLRFSVFPSYHMMYTDESLYLEMASNFNHRLQPVQCLTYDAAGETCLPLYTKPPGWPFLISLGFLAFGEEEGVGFFLSALFGSLSILFIFILGFLIFRSDRAGLWAAFLLALSPLHILWSHSSETNIPSTFFVLLVLAVLFLYRETSNNTLLLPLLALFLLSVSIRYENVLFLLLMAPPFCADAIARYSSKHRTALLAGLLIIPMFLALAFVLQVAELFYINLAFSTLPSLYLTRLPSFLGEISINYAYFALSLPLLMRRNRRAVPENSIFFVAGALLIFSIFTLPIYSESRFALTPSVFLILLAALSLDRICSAARTKIPALLTAGIILLLLFGWIANLHEGKRRIFPPGLYFSDLQLLETESSRQIRDSVPRECIIIADQPVVIEPTPIRLMHTNTAILNPSVVDTYLKKGECIYFFSDIYCTGAVMDSLRTCRRFLEMFSVSPELSFSQKTNEYTLFKVIDYHPAPQTSRPDST